MKAIETASNDTILEALEDDGVDMESLCQTLNADESTVAQILRATAVKTYAVSCDPYENGARISWTVKAMNPAEAKRKARNIAEDEGVMRAGWKRIEVAEVQ